MDKDIRVKAIVLRSFAYKTTHKRLELITSDNKTINALYYKSKKVCKISLPTSGVFYLSKTKEQYPYVIKDFDLSYDYDFVYKDFDKLRSYQIYTKVIEQLKDTTNLYNILKASFALLEHYDAKKVDIVFLLSLIKEQGWAFDLRSCAMCSKEYNNQIIYYNFSTLSNCCKDCSNDTKTLYLPPNAQKYLRLYENTDITKVLDLEISQTTLDSIHRYLLRYVSLLLNDGINNLNSVIM